jgi:hypothetical protein
VIEEYPGTGGAVGLLTARHQQSSPDFHNLSALLIYGQTRGEKKSKGNGHLCPDD